MNLSPFPDAAYYNNLSPFFQIQPFHDSSFDTFDFLSHGNNDASVIGIDHNDVTGIGHDDVTGIDHNDIFERLHTSRAGTGPDLNSFPGGLMDWSENCASCNDDSVYFYNVETGQRELGNLGWETGSSEYVEAGQDAEAEAGYEVVTSEYSDAFYESFVNGEVGNYMECGEPGIEMETPARDIIDGIEGTSDQTEVDVLGEGEVGEEQGGSESPVDERFTVESLDNVTDRSTNDPVAEPLIEWNSMAIMEGNSASAVSPRNSLNTAPCPRISQDVNAWPPPQVSPTTLPSLHRPPPAVTFPIPARTDYDLLSKLTADLVRRPLPIPDSSRDRLLQAVYSESAIHDEYMNSRIGRKTPVVPNLPPTLVDKLKCDQHTANINRPRFKKGYSKKDQDKEAEQGENVAPPAFNTRQRTAPVPHPQVTCSAEGASLPKYTSPHAAVYPSNPRRVRDEYSLPDIIGNQQVEIFYI